MTSGLKRQEIRMPAELLERIDQYKDDKAHVSRTAAILELLRNSLDQHEKTK